MSDNTGHYKAHERTNERDDGRTQADEQTKQTNHCARLPLLQSAHPSYLPTYSPAHPSARHHGAPVMENKNNIQNKSMVSSYLFGVSVNTMPPLGRCAGVCSLY
jgi:hypothetical protein